MSEARAAPDDKRRGSGFAARRAIVRWAWRLFRREWHQQALVLGLLTLAVLASIVSATIAYNVAPAEGRAGFGDASHLLRFDGSDPDLLTRSHCLARCPAPVFPNAVAFCRDGRRASYRSCHPIP